MQLIPKPFNDHIVLFVNYPDSISATLINGRIYNDIAANNFAKLHNLISDFAIFNFAGQKTKDELIALLDTTKKFQFIKGNTIKHLLSGVRISLQPIYNSDNYEPCSIGPVEYFKNNLRYAIA